MKVLLKLEISKAIKNKFFVFSILIGCALALLSLYYNVNVYWDYMQEQADLQAGQVLNPLAAMFSLFNHWMGGEGFSLGSSIFFTLFPLLVSIPYSWSYCEEKKSGYVRSMVVSSGREVYLLSKYLSVFLSGGLAMIIPLVFSFLMTALFFPAVLPNVIYDTSYGVFGGSLLSNLYYTMPFMHVIVYLCLDFLFGGMVACIGLAVTSFVRYRVVVVIMPLFILLIVHYSGQFFYLLEVQDRKEISPLSFLRCMQSGYASSWFVILIELAILFICTFSIVMIREGKREIY